MGKEDWGRKLKQSRVVFLLAAVLLSLTACDGGRQSEPQIQPDEDGQAVLEIEEETFVKQTNAINQCPADFAGQRVQIEGIYYTEEAGGHTYAFVVRNTPGEEYLLDGLAGLEINLPVPEPSYGAWVKIIGVLQESELNGQPAPLLIVEELTEKARPGAITVTE